MPFDSTNLDQPARPVRARSKLTTTARARRVIAALRDPDLRPLGFHWDYSDAPTCAIGLTGLMFNHPRRQNIKVEDAADLLGLDPRQSSRVFSGAAFGGALSGVPAGRVADVLEACVKENQG